MISRPAAPERSQTTFWHPASETPKQDAQVIVAAWEFGCLPVFVICKAVNFDTYTKFYLDTTYGADCPVCVADVVHFWAYIPDLPAAPERLAAQMRLGEA